MIALLKILHAGAIFSSGLLLMHTMSYLVGIPRKNFCRLLLFAGCSLLCGTIIFIGDPINILITTPVFVVLVLFTCEGSFWKKVTIGLMFSSTIFSFNALRDNYIHDALPEALCQVEHGYTISCLFSLPFALMLYLCTRKFAPDQEYTLSDSLWRLLLLLAITPFGIVLSVVSLFHLSDSSVDIHSHQEYAFLLFIALLAFISLLWCITVLARQQKLEQQSMFTEINRKYYEAMEQQHIEVRRLKHDLANHLQVLSALPDDRRADYLGGLAGNTAFSQSFSYCGDSTVNAVLTVKKSVIERYHISMEMDLEIPLTLPYDKTDICALYANALDNAMEACMKLEEKSRKISVISKAGKGLFCLEVRNPISDIDKTLNLSQPPNTLHKAESRPKAANTKIPSGYRLLPTTSKADKANHGFGLKSIQEVVNRYHGHMELKIENSIFELFLYLPLPKYP